ncbi:DUF2809 domain-containing protein [Saxibacter everestensis]|uniref:DUF2809 domain-containing protein n=1 Tax=Saxibacter everestensis TaxID=2909229 RepID=A0ABY8QS89_9MICO|nr:DUF2809 domain-containing protein [Brevibacteriaceae bacterium ZFBP1038]
MSGEAHGRGMRRPMLFATGLLVTAAGLAVHLLGSGTAAGLVADGLYAVLVYLILAFAWPRAAILRVGSVALLACVLIELAQLSLLPAALASWWAPFRLVLGTTFSAVDLVAYAGGVLAALGGDAGAARLARRRSGKADEQQLIAH